MNIKDLEKIMIEYGVVLRAIPKKVREIYEKNHIDEHPNGVIKYLEKFKREMLVVETTPTNAGKFTFTCQKNTLNNVNFKDNVFFDSIEDVINYLENNYTL